MVAAPCLYASGILLSEPRWGLRAGELESRLSLGRDVVLKVIGVKLNARRAGTKFSLERPEVPNSSETLM